MKIKGVPGERAFKALVKISAFDGWVLTDRYYLTSREVDLHSGGLEFKWPVEVDQFGMVYIPDASEFE